MGSADVSCVEEGMEESMDEWSAFRRGEMWSGDHEM